MGGVSALGVGSFMEGFLKGFKLVSDIEKDKKEKDLRQEELDRKTREADEKAKTESDKIIADSTNKALSYASKAKESETIESYNSQIDLHNNEVDNLKRSSESAKTPGSKKSFDDVLAKTQYLPYARIVSVKDANGVAKDVVVQVQNKTDIDSTFNSDGLILGEDGLVYGRQMNDDKTYTNKADNNISPIKPIELYKKKETLEDRIVEEELKKNPSKSLLEIKQGMNSTLTPVTITTKDGVTTTTMATSTEIAMAKASGATVEKEITPTNPVPYKVPGKKDPVLLTAEEFSKLPKKVKEKIVPYEKPKEPSSGSEGNYQRIVEPDGRVIYYNSKTMQEFTKGEVVKTKDVIKQEKEAESLANRIRIARAFINTAKTESPEIFGSIGSGTLGFLETTAKKAVNYDDKVASNAKILDSYGEIIQTAIAGIDNTQITDRDAKSVAGLSIKSGQSYDTNMANLAEAERLFNKYGVKMPSAPTKQAPKQVGKTKDGVPVYSDSQGMYIIKNGKKIRQKKGK